MNGKGSAIMCWVLARLDTVHTGVLLAVSNFSCIFFHILTSVFEPCVEPNRYFQLMTSKNGCIVLNLGYYQFVTISPGCLKHLFK